MKRYDWIIVGGSFAGLATARGLPGKGIIIDRKPIGEGETSACGTLIDVPRVFNAEESIAQLHNELILHTNKKEVVIPTPYPFCTIDYKTFCTKLASSERFDFLQARVIRREKHRVITSKGDLEAPILVDASGWQSVLTNHSGNNNLNTGIETILPGKEKGLHFFYEGRKTKRIHWIFPAGRYLRIGSGSYFSKEKIKYPLISFLKNRNFSNHRQNFHGNAFPFSLRKPVIGEIFRVGDSAGQCLAFTGEGIRPALYFGTFLNKILKKLIRGRITLKSAQNIYTDFVCRKRKYFWVFTWFQYSLTPLPDIGVIGFGNLCRRWAFPLLQKYRKIFDIAEVR